MAAGISVLDGLTRFLPWQKSWVIDQVAGEVARQCRAGVWQRIADQAGAMSIAEVRGYTRARSMKLLDEEVQRACTRHRLGDSWRSSVLASAMDQLIVMVVRDVLSEQPPCVINTIAA